ncbi:MAG: asparagine synthase-related protein [Lysobacter sp.]|nr:asparagine synthase-related protein [Lysobacter sp.]
MTKVLGEFVVSLRAAGEPRAPASPVPRGCPAALQGIGWQRIEPGPGLAVAWGGSMRCLVEGHRGGIGLAREPERGGSGSAAAAVADRAIRAWLDDPEWSPRELRGRFVFVFWDARERTIAAFTDAFRTYPVFHRCSPGRTTCASDLRLLLGADEAPARIDRTAIYHYLNFAYVPSPHCAIEGAGKVPPGSRLDASPGKVATRREWDPRYPEDLEGPDDVLAEGLRESIVRTVRGYRPGPDTAWGTFLSGGTDSSSIAGILAGEAGVRVDSFSIGFEEQAFDEISFSRLAVSRFGLVGHERIVGEAQTVDAIPLVAAGFDEPFGNPSAIPTWYCASLAAGAGKEMLLAGDGGDEIFGGNERYAKNKVFDWYHRAPAMVRAAARLAAGGMGRIDLHATNRLRNMIRRGELPNPDRFYSDDSFASDHFAAMLTPEFRAGIEPDASLDIQRELFRSAQTASELHRLMYLDLRLTIAESDLVKVLRASRIAGIDVAFPYIDRELVEYAGRLPDRHKVRGLDKRHLFKAAMAGILPPEILRKKKQGFGLPVNVWLRRGGALRDLVREVVLSDRSLGRGYFEPRFVRGLFEAHERGSWDHSPEIFRLLMLELWHRECLERRAAGPVAADALRVRTAAPGAAAGAVPGGRAPRVLMVLEATFPRQGGGGAESQVQTIGASLVREGVLVRVVVPMVPGGSRQERQDLQGIEVVRLRYPNVRYVGPAIMLAKLAWKLVRKRRQYDVVHCHIAHNMTAVGVLVGRLLGKRVLVKLTGSHEMVGGILDPHPGAASRIRRLAIRNATLFQATSTRIRGLLAERGFDPSRVLVIPNGVDVGRFLATGRDEALRQRLLGGASLLGIFVGRLSPEKGLDVLLEAWGEAFGRKGDARLVLVGEGPERDALGSLAARLGIGGQVVFAGHCGDVERYLAAADFGLLTSFAEGLSNALLEYMAAGLPVVGSRVSGTEDFVAHGENGWLFEPGSREGLAGCLADAASAGGERLRRMGEAARARIVASASREAITRRLIEAYGISPGTPAERGRGNGPGGAPCAG